jgi:hypothetical protein
MRLAPDGLYYLTNEENGQGPSTRFQDGSEFFDNPFRSITSTIAFLGLCAFVVTSILILTQKYRQARNYKISPSRPRPAPNLESARAFSSGIETGQTWTWKAESEIATAGLMDIRRGAISGGREFSPVGIITYEGSESDEGEWAEDDWKAAMVTGTLQHDNAQETNLTPPNTDINKNKAVWTKHEQAGVESDQLRRSLRSRMVVPNGVVVGQVGDSGIAQRRRATSNRSMQEL